jgi:citrate lyase subunit beta/citryl-CoA lyase
MLFVPATRVDRVDKAFARGADAVIVDLEDAVPPEQKAAARAAVAALPGRAEVWVRCNDARTAEFVDDLALLSQLPWPAGVVLPKAENADDIHAVVAAAPDLPVLALVESAAGLLAAERLAGAGAHRLALGPVDYCRDLGVALGRDEQVLAYPRSVLAVVSRAYGLPAPVDGPVTALGEADILESSARRARALGCGGKLCVHPDQVGPVNAAFSPSADERQWAEGVVAATAHGDGVFRYEGEMVDAPVVQRARDILATPQ